MTPKARSALAFYLRALHFYRLNGESQQEAEETASRLATRGQATALIHAAGVLALRRGALPFGPGQAGPMPRA